MIAAAQLAGTFVAHGIWSVSDGAVFDPMLAYTDAASEQAMERLALGDLAAAVEYGRQRLVANPMNAAAAVLVFHGRITLPREQLEAVIAQLRAYSSPHSQATIAVPYTPRASGQFRVHRPKLLQWQGCGHFDQAAALRAFFAGVASHEQGAKIWNAALDESK